MFKNFFKNNKSIIYFTFAILAIALIGARSYLSSFIKSNSLKIEIQDIVREYIDQNPETIINSVMKLQEKKMQEMKQHSQEALTNNKAALESSDHQPFLGNKDAKFVVVQFFDYRCGHCKHSNSDLNKFLTENPDSKIVYRNLAVLGPDSIKAAQAALAVYKLYPASYKEFHNDLITATAINDKVLEALFIKYNMDKSNITKEMGSEDVQKILDGNRELASKLGMRGVPAYIINGEFVASVNYDMLKAKKASELPKQ